VQVTSSRDAGRNVGLLGAREMALHSSEKDRSDAIAAVRYSLMYTLICFNRSRALLHQKTCGNCFGSVLYMPFSDWAKSVKC